MRDTLPNILDDELSLAVDWLASSDPEKGIHEARRSLKRMRAALRLMRSKLDKERFRMQDEFWREASRRLSPYRDQTVIVLTFDKIRKRNEDALRPDQWQSIRDLMAKQVKKANRGRALTALRSNLIHGATGAVSWIPGTVDHDTMKEGFRRTHKRGRKAFRRAHADPAPVRLHDLRKQANYLRAQIQLLHELKVLLPSAYTESTDRLVKRLGSNNDLVILSHAIGQLKLPANQLSLVKKLIEDRSDTLVAEALNDAGMVYGKKPAEFVEL